MNRYKDNHHTMGLGVPTLLVTFVVLGMVILSMLTYLKEESNTKIVEKEIEYTKNFYLADSKAKQLINDEKNTALKNECLEYSFDNGVLKFIINVDDKHVINVEKDNGIVVHYALESKEK